VLTFINGASFVEHFLTCTGLDFFFNFVQSMKINNEINNINENKKDQKPEAGLLNKRLMLSSSFRCDQSDKYKLYDFSHILLCYLSRTQMFNKLTGRAEFTKLLVNFLHQYFVWGA
jgi:hypothetical protein